MPTQFPAVGGCLSGLQPSALPTGSLALVAQSSPAANPNDSPHTRQEMAVMGAAALLIVTLLLLRWTHLRRKARSRAAGHDRSASLAIPCPTCRYFHPNAFLPCAVNPAQVMSQAAASCKDYCSRQAETVSRSGLGQDDQA